LTRETQRLNREPVAELIKEQTRQGTLRSDGSMFDNRAADGFHHGFFDRKAMAWSIENPIV
jgi:hypothetical protein